MRGAVAKVFLLQCVNAPECGLDFRVDSKDLSRLRKLIELNLMPGVLCPLCQSIEYLRRIANLMLAMPTATPPRPAAPPSSDATPPPRWA